MIVCAAGNTIAEFECDLWPTGLRVDRAHELLTMHNGCSPHTCAVRFAVVSAFVGIHTRDAMTHWLQRHM